MHRSHHFHFLKNREMNELYLSVAIRSFALSMIGIFIPIYLVEIGYSSYEVLAFFAVFSIVHALFVLPAAKISSRFGFKHGILGSIPLLIIFILGMYNLEQMGWLFYWLAVILGASGALYWVGYHIDFSMFSDKENRGKEVGLARVLFLVFHVAGPIAGGFILAVTNFSTLFLIVVGLLFLSAMPLFLSKDVHTPILISIREIFRGQSLRNVITFLGHGIESGINLVIWPIFIFYAIANDFTALGFISSLSLLFSLLFVFIVGRFSETYRRLIMHVGAFINALVWGLRFLARTMMQVVVIDSIYGISQTMIRVPFDAISYEKANQDSIVRFIVFREMTIHTGRTIMFIAAMFLASLSSTFTWGGAGSLLYLLF